MSTLTFEVVVHEDDADGRFAEWDVFREFADGHSERLTSGTSGTLESAIDHALDGLRGASSQDTRDS